LTKVQLGSTHFQTMIILYGQKHIQASNLFDWLFLLICLCFK